MNDLFIKIHNEFITEDSEYHLSDKELYLYSLLLMDKRMDGNIYTNISVLSHFMKIKFSNRESRNVKVLKGVFDNLIAKNLIYVTNNDSKLKHIDFLKSIDPIVISFRDIESKGHTQIPYNEFFRCESLQDLYIYTSVKRWENSSKNRKGVFSCSYDRFARILQVTKATAQKNIEKAIEENLIYRNSGNYIKDETKQDVNEYRCTPFTENEKTSMTKKKGHESKFSSDDVLAHCDYDNQDLEDHSIRWKDFEVENEYGQIVDYIPDFEDHLIVLEVLENTKNRNPTLMEADLLDKFKWRESYILGTYYEGEYNLNKEEAERQFNEKYNCMEDI